MRKRRLLIYLAPALMDMVLAQFMFVNAVRLAQMGASAATVAGVVTVWGVVYLIACPIVGRFLNVANSTRLMLAACAVLAVLSLLHLVFPSVAAIYVLMACAGIACALFFPAFQVFMKAVAVARASTIAFSTGVYTFAWSMGFAVGPFIAGFMLQFGGVSGWKLAFIFGTLMSVVIAAVIFLLKHLRHDPVAPAVSIPVGGGSPRRGAIDYARLPDLVWLGWLSGGVGVLVLSLGRGVFPARAVGVLGLSAGLQGTLFFLLSLTQAFVGLACCRSRLWMYRAGPVLASGSAGIAGCLCLGYATTLPVLALGAVLIGFYAGTFFFYLVFHALAHPSRSAQYVSVNESLVGVGGIIGPVLGGVIADRAGFGPAYATAAVVLLATIAVQTVAHRRYAAAVDREADAQ